MSENQETAGTFWYWWYKDALPTGSKLPSFKLDGRKGWFYRSTIDSSSPQMQTSCLIFFPKPDHQVDSFASQLSPMFKTQLVLGKNKNRIHLIVTCKTMEEFDQRTKNLPSDVLVWADLGGQVAEKFGMRPMVQSLSLSDLFGGKENRKWEKETVLGVFFVVNGIIVKSPRYQPKLQIANLGNIKNCWDLIEKANGDVKKVMSPSSFAADLTEEEIKSKQPKAWEKYQTEYNMMIQDLGLKPAGKVAKTADKKKTPLRKVAKKMERIKKAPLGKKTEKKVVKRTTTKKKPLKKTVTKKKKVPRKMPTKPQEAFHVPTEEKQETPKEKQASEEEKVEIAPNRMTTEGQIRSRL